jgi:hypothetical protein
LFKIFDHICFGNTETISEIFKICWFENGLV